MATTSMHSTQHVRVSHVVKRSLFIEKINSLWERAQLLIMLCNKLLMFSRELGNSISFANVFFLESFPLYGIFTQLIITQKI